MVTIDENALKALLSLGQSGAPGLFEKVFRMFEDSSPEMIEAMQSGFAAGDTETVRSAAHSLKSSAAYLGGVDLSSSCKVIEAAARSDTLEEQRETIEGLTVCFEETRSAISDFIDQQPESKKAA